MYVGLSEMSGSLFYRTFRTSSMSMQRIEILVSGRVQGVGYRAFVVAQAERLGVRGWTKNCSNGDVLTIAEGSRPMLDEFLTALLEGPRYAEVMRHTATYSVSTGEFTDFMVRY